MRAPRKADLIDSAKIVIDQGQVSEAFSKIFVELHVELLDSSRPFSYRIYRYPFGDMTFIRSVTRGGLHQVMRTAALIKKSTRNNFYIGLILSGEATLIQDDHTANLLKDDIAILDSTKEYTILVPDSFDALWVSVPRYRLEGRMNLPGHILAQRIDGNLGSGHVASKMLHAALEEASNVDNTGANRIANHILDLITLSLQINYDDISSHQSTYLKSVLRRIQHYIEDHLDEEDLSPEKISRDNGISIRYLSKLFSREGTSTARWIRMRRLERCRYDLEDNGKSHQSINEIAYSHGFSNISSFNRAFRRHFELSPSAIRQKAQGERTDSEILRITV